MLRNSETLGVGFVWVTLTFFLHSFDDFFSACFVTVCVAFFCYLKIFVFLNYKSQRNFVWFSLFALLLALSCTPHCHHSLALLHILVYG